MKFPYFILCISLSFCSLKKIDNVIIIKGVVKNISAKKVYLADANNWKISLDSADYKNDTFSFHIKPNNFEPYLASIYYIDSKGKLQVLIYQNNILSTNDKIYW